MVGRFLYHLIFLCESFFSHHIMHAVAEKVVCHIVVTFVTLHYCYQLFKLSLDE